MSEELKKLEELLANDRKIIEDNYKEIERLHTIIKEVREILKYYGNKEDIVGYAYYSITGESLLELLEILDNEK